jgi:hypothetical protein
MFLRYLLLMPNMETFSINNLPGFAFNASVSDPAHQFRQGCTAPW